MEIGAPPAGAPAPGAANTPPCEVVEVGVFTGEVITTSGAGGVGSAFPRRAAEAVVLSISCGVESNVGMFFSFFLYFLVQIEIMNSGSQC